MRLIIITPPTDVPGEARTVRRILEQSAATLHLRKPSRDEGELAVYLERIPVGLHHRIMVHGHPRLRDRFDLQGIHFSERQRRQHPEAPRKLRREDPQCRISAAFHRIGTIPEHDGVFDYLLLSPVFDSISKPGYRAAFGHAELKRWLGATGHAVVALGGVDRHRIAAAADLGFQGVAALGAVWAHDDPLSAARRLSGICRQHDGLPDHAGQAT